MHPKSDKIETEQFHTNVFICPIAYQLHWLCMFNAKLHCIGLIKKEQIVVQSGKLEEVARQCDRRKGLHTSYWIVSWTNSTNSKYLFLVMRWNSRILASVQLHVFCSSKVCKFLWYCIWVDPCAYFLVWSYVESLYV